MTMLTEEERLDQRADVEETFTDQAVIERNTTTATNPDGTPAAATWVADDDLVACSYWVDFRQRLNGGETAGAALMVRAQNMQMMVPVETDVSELDRIHGVTRDGETLNANILEIRAVVLRPTHKLLILEQQTHRSRSTP